MPKDTWGYVAVQTANEHENLSRERFSPLVCQCCGHKRRNDTEPECVCAGLEWYMDKGGAVECQAHRFARAVSGTKKRFLFFGGR